MKNRYDPSIGDIVEVAYAKPRRGLVVGQKDKKVGIRYFKPSAVPGTADDFVWWIDKTHVKIISSANQKTHI